MAGPYYTNTKVDNVDFIEAADLEAIETGFSNVDSDKANKATPGTAHNLAGLKSTGDLEDSGVIVINSTDTVASNGNDSSIPTTLAIKSYVDSQVGANNELSEILGNGNTTGGNNVLFGDNDKAIFGAGSDLQIYHTGSNSVIREAGTGVLYLQAASAIHLLGDTASETMASFAENGACSFRYDNATKLATTSTGIDVTGTVTADRLVSIDTTGTNYSLIENRGSGVSKDTLVLRNYGSGTNATGQGVKLVLAPTANDVTNRNATIEAIQNGNNSIDMRFKTSAGSDPVERMRVTQNGDIYFFDPTGTNASLYYDASTKLVVNEDSRDFDFRVESDANTHALFVEGSSGRLGIGTSSPTYKLTISDDGTSGYCAMAFVDTSNSNKEWRIDQSGSALRFTESGVAQRMIITSNGYVGIGASTPTSQLHLEETTANTTTRSDQLKIVPLSSGTTGVGFGSNIYFVGQRNGGALQGMGRIGFGASTNTTTNLSSDFIVETATAGVPSEAMRIDANGRLIVHGNQGGGSFDSPNPGIYFDKQQSVAESNVPSIYAVTETNTTGLSIGARSSSGNTTLYQGGYDRLRLNVSETSVNESGLDKDFRVESDGNTHMLFVDGGSSKVSIGSSGTARQFNNYINDSTTYNSTSFETSSLSYYMRNTDATVGAYTGIQFAIGTNSDCGIAGVRTADANAALVFGNRISGSGAITERMRIDGGTGYVGIGRTTPYCALDVQSDVGSGGVIARFGNSDATYSQTVSLSFDSAKNTILDSGSSTGGFIWEGGTNGYVFNDSGQNNDFRVESDSNSSMLFVNAGTNKVGIGSGATVGTLSVYENGVSTSHSDPHIFLRNATNATGAKCLINTGFTSTGGAGYTPVAFGGLASNADNGVRDGAFVVYVADADNVDPSNDERMRVKETGLLVGTTTGGMTSTGCSIGTNGTASFVCNLTSVNQAVILNNNNSTGTNYDLEFRQNNVAVGKIRAGSTGVTYYTSSDRRLKENIETITDGTDKLMAMNPVTHTWKADPDAPAVHGFIAQEMQDVIPEAVSGEDGGAEMMSMDYGRITPVIVAALQDAHREIQNLKAEIAALKGDK